MNVENMNELIEKLLTKKVIIPMSQHDDKENVEWFNENFEQYIIDDYDVMVTYCNDNGYITDLAGFSKDLQNNWNGYTFDDAKIVVESIHDKIVDSCVCNLQLWRQESL